MTIYFHGGARAEVVEAVKVMPEYFDPRGMEGVASLGAIALYDEAGVGHEAGRAE